MLESFNIRRQYHKLVVRLHVDCAKRDAQATVFYDGRIVQLEIVQFGDVATPEKAQAWLSRPVKVTGGELALIEALERRYAPRAA